MSDGAERLTVRGGRRGERSAQRMAERPTTELTGTPLSQDYPDCEDEQASRFTGRIRAIRINLAP